MARKPFVPPRTIVRAAWRVHRAIARRGPGRGLWRPGQRNAWGALQLTTRGRLSGQQRVVIVAYLLDGDRLHTLAMNGWGEGHPAWWQNLQADPHAEVMLPDGSSIAVLAHRAEGAEQERLWARWVEINPGMDRLAAERHTPTEVVVLDPV